MLWLVIFIGILVVAIAVFLINKKITKKPEPIDKDAYGASFGDCSLDLEELHKKAEEKNKTKQ